MSLSSNRGERITAIISAAVAVVILTVGVTAQQYRSAPVDAITQLESDFRFQLERAFNHDTKEREHRLQQLNQVIADWNNADRTETDKELLANWLSEATVRSMPGSLQALPPLPEFGKITETPEPSQPVATPFVSNLNEEEESEDPFFSEEFAIKESAILEAEKDASENQAYAAETTYSDIEELQATTKVINTVLVERKPSVSLSRLQTAKPNEQASINLSKLSAKINTYNAGLTEIESSLDSAANFNLSVASALVDQIEQLARNRRFLTLYYDALTAQEKRSVTSPSHLNPYLKQLAEKIHELDSAEPDDFLSDFESAGPSEAESLLQRLETIANRSE